MNGIFLTNYTQRYNCMAGQTNNVVMYLENWANIEIIIVLCISDCPS